MTETVIHPTAVVHPKCELAEGVHVGPFAVIEEGVRIGAGCRIGPHVVIAGQTVLGSRNSIHAGCVIGDAPQDLKYQGAATPLSIGDGNTFREHATVHRSNQPDDPTVIGSNNFFMAHSHVGHNSRIGNRIIMANGSMLGGHVIVEDAAFISGNCAVHQFVRIGTLSIMQGGSRLSKDLPPYCALFGVNRLCGLNTVGLRRAGIGPEDRRELKDIYRRLFRGGMNLRNALEELGGTVKSTEARHLVEFVASSKRGVCVDTGRSGRDSDPAE